VNREQKRLMQRQGQMNPDGTPSTRRAQATQQPRSRQKRNRTSIGQFFREVREELRQVSWPTRPELINYTSITLFVLLIMIALIFGLNFGFGKVVTFLFQR
jgi:preprotein translocase subunit SecE